MIRIEKILLTDCVKLAEIAKQTFIESHGMSASKEDIDAYILEKFNIENFKKELSDANNLYHFIYVNEELAGYSKIICNATHSNISNQNITKLERLYILKSFYQSQLGIKLLQFNIDLAKARNQMGMWLFVWVENQRAIRFYLKHGFEIIGSHDFQISATHSNPNHQMYLSLILHEN